MRTIQELAKKTQSYLTTTKRPSGDDHENVFPVNTKAVQS